MAEKIGDAFVEISARVAKFESAMSKVSARMKKTGKSFKEFGRSMTLRVTAPITAAAGVSANSFIKFEASMRNVNVIARQSEKDFANTTQSVIGLSRELGKSPNELAVALFNINSASFKAEEGLKVLDAATVAGRAGVANTANAARSLTGILNAYGLSANSAGDVSDILFKTVEKGVITFSELSNNLGSTAATARAAKVPFDQVAAGIATLTRGGIKSTEAFTSINRLMLAFIKPSEALTAALEEQKGMTGEALLRTEGLAGAVEFLTEATDGSTTKMTDFVPSIRAVRAAFSLARDEGKAYAGDLQQIATQAGRAGATQDAFKEQTKALAFQVDRLKAAYSIMAIQIGEVLSPAIRVLADLLTRVSDKFDSMSEGSRKTAIRIALVVAAIGPLITAIGGLLITMLEL